MIEQWQELKETITELRDNNGTGTQQEICKFLANMMDNLEKQIEPQESEEQMIYRQNVKAILECIFAGSKDELIEVACERINGLKEYEINKIRAEIMDTGAYEQEVNGKTEFLKGINYCLGVIDKYR